MDGDLYGTAECHWGMSAKGWGTVYKLVGAVVRGAWIPPTHPGLVTPTQFDGCGVGKVRLAGHSLAAVLLLGRQSLEIRKRPKDSSPVDSRKLSSYWVSVNVGPRNSGSQPFGLSLATEAIGLPP
jgi:hypothetical protein